MSRDTDLAVIKNSMDFDMKHHRRYMQEAQASPSGPRKDAVAYHRDRIKEIRAQALLLGITLSESPS